MRVLEAHGLEISMRRNDKLSLTVFVGARIPIRLPVGISPWRLTKVHSGFLWKPSQTRQRCGKSKPRVFFPKPLLIPDVTRAPTLGHCHGGHGPFRKGIWVYAPLISPWPHPGVFIWLPPGNVVIPEGWCPWIEAGHRVSVRPQCGRSRLRGDRISP